MQAFSEEDRMNYVNTLQLITDKPVMYVCNVSEDAAVDGNDYVNQIKAAVA